MRATARWKWEISREPNATRNENADEAVGALVTLGYPAPMAQKAVSAILKADNEVQAVEEMIKRALKML